MNPLIGYRYSLLRMYLWMPFKKLIDPVLPYPSISSRGLVNDLDNIS